MLAIHAVLLLANIALFAAIIGVGHILKAGGPTFSLGCFVGFAFFYICHRITDGYWYDPLDPIRNRQPGAPPETSTPET